MITLTMNYALGSPFYGQSEAVKLDVSPHPSPCDIRLAFSERDGAKEKREELYGLFPESMPTIQSGIAQLMAMRKGNGPFHAYEVTA